MQAFAARTFDAEDAACAVPVGSRPDGAQASAKRQKVQAEVSKIATSVEAVLAEIAHMGAGLVHSIQPIVLD